MLDHDHTLTFALAGDVMLGRGIDQILAHPGDPTLREGYVRDARDYVAFAEEASGAVPRPVDPTWPWGDALEALDDAAPDVRILNLETSITTSDDFASGKRVHYRMHPDNVGALATARPDCTTLANNHVLDFGRAGLAETLAVLSGAGLSAAGAGRDEDVARRPCVASTSCPGRHPLPRSGCSGASRPTSAPATSCSCRCTGDRTGATTWART